MVVDLRKFGLMSKCKYTVIEGQLDFFAVAPRVSSFLLHVKETCIHIIKKIIIIIITILMLHGKLLML